MVQHDGVNTGREVTRASRRLANTRPILPARKKKQGAPKTRPGRSYLIQ